MHMCVLVSGYMFVYEHMHIQVCMHVVARGQPAHLFSALSLGSHPPWYSVIDLLWSGTCVICKADQ